MQNSTEQGLRIMGAPHVPLTFAAQVGVASAMEAMDTRAAAGNDIFPVDVLFWLLGFPDTDDLYHITKDVAERVLREHGTDEHLSNCNDVGFLDLMGRLEVRMPDRFPGWLEKALHRADAEATHTDEFVMRIVRLLSRCWVYRTDRPEEAERLRQRELDYERRRHGGDSFATFWPRMNIATSCFEVDDLDEAAEHLRAATRVWGDDNTVRIADMDGLWSTLDGFFNCYHRDLNDAAEELFKKAAITMIPMLEANGTKGAAEILLSLADIAPSEQDEEQLRAAGNRILEATREEATSRPLATRFPDSTTQER